MESYKLTRHMYQGLQQFILQYITEKAEDTPGIRDVFVYKAMERIWLRLEKKKTAKHSVTLYLEMDEILAINLVAQEIEIPDSARSVINRFILNLPVELIKIIEHERTSTTIDQLEKSESKSLQQKRNGNPL